MTGCSGVKFETTRVLMREAGWDPQTHDREYWFDVDNALTRLMNALAQGNRVNAVRQLTKTSNEVSELLDRRYRLVSSPSLQPEGIKAILQKQLAPHYKVPPVITVK